MNTKFDTLSNTVNQMQIENNILKEQNEKLNDKVSSLSDKLTNTEKLLNEQASKQDKLEYFSRRNNLKLREYKCHVSNQAVGKRSEYNNTYEPGQWLLDLNICTLDIQGLNKYDADPLFTCFCNKFDIVGLCETWQSRAGAYDRFLPGFVNFDSIRLNTKGRGSGGVTVFIKDWLLNTNSIKRIYCHWSECVI